MPYTEEDLAKAKVIGRVLPKQIDGYEPPDWYEVVDIATDTNGHTYYVTNKVFEVTYDYRGRSNVVPVLIVDIMTETYQPISK